MGLPAPAAPAVEPWRWRIVWLLFLATMINYMDRLALNNTQRHILAEFVPAPTDSFGAAAGAAGFAHQSDAVSKQRNRLYADVQFAFGVSFALFQVVAGFLVDRFSLRWLYLGAIIVWSAAGVLTGFIPAGAVAMLMMCRIVLGVGEAFNWPCAVATVRRVIPRESRGLANGIFHSGASIGAMATPFLVLMMVGDDGSGWRSVFIVVGAVGAFWALLWLLNTGGDRAGVIDGSPPPDPDARDQGPPPAFVRVLGMRLFWVCLATGCAVNVCWHFYNQWFPRYLTEDARVSARQEQWVLAGFFIAADLGSMFSGWLTRKLIRSGYTVERSRKLVMVLLALCVFAASVPAALIGGASASLPLFFVVAASAMGGFAIFFSLAQDIVPRHTAQILGVCGAVSWLLISGVTMLVGSLAGPGRYATLFIVIGCVPLVAALAGLLWPEPKRRVPE